MYLDGVIPKFNLKVMKSNGDEIKAIDSYVLGSSISSAYASPSKKIWIKNDCKIYLDSNALTSPLSTDQYSINVKFNGPAPEYWTFDQILSS